MSEFDREVPLGGGDGRTGMRNAEESVRPTKLTNRPPPSRSSPPEPRPEPPSVGRRDAVRTLVGIPSLASVASAAVPFLASVALPRPAFGSSEKPPPIIPLTTTARRLRAVPTFAIVDGEGVPFHTYDKDSAGAFGYFFASYTSAEYVLEDAQKAFAKAKREAAEKKASGSEGAIGEEGTGDVPDAWGRAQIVTIPLDVAMQLSVKKTQSVAQNGKGKKFSTFYQVIPDTNDLNAALKIENGPRYGERGRVPLFYVDGLTIPSSEEGSDGAARPAYFRVADLKAAALDTKLACNNILTILNCADFGKHDLALDCQQWQHGLRALYEKLTNEDMLDPFQIPETFDLDDPDALQGPFTNLLTDFNDVSLEKAQRWQQYLRKYAADVELESDRWAAEIMLLSMTPELKALVIDALEEITDRTMVGAVTIFKIMCTHMVLINQETIDALHEWLRTFDIRKFDGENVVVAVLQCRAVIRALDGVGLPANVLRCLLDGFAKASSEAFAQLCVTLQTMNQSALVQSVQASLSVKTKCFNVLRDLETTYVELCTGGKWAGAEHDGAAFRASLAPSALVARHEQKYSSWAKDKECFECGEKGHIGRYCPNKKKSDRADKRQGRRWNNKNQSDASNSRGAASLQESFQDCP